LLKAEHPNTVFLDGDMIRAIAGNDLGHTVEDRWENGLRISRLCLELERQDILVVCAVLSIFHESQSWNRENYQDYYEVFIDVPFELLVGRDNKGLYKSALSGEVDNVVGVDIPFTPPSQPDLIVRNDGTLGDFLANAKEIARLLPGQAR
jgi:adenylylsulfate kinase